MRLPCDLHNGADSHARICVRTAERVHYEQPLARQLFESNVLTSVPCFLGSRMIIVLIFIRRPPYGIFGVLIHNNEFIFW